VIRYLHLTNFRRHANTEISFEDAGQIVLIAGNNGAGKSTIVEAILYGLYGEGRHGNRYIDRMIRRGFEIEGMEVEIEFDVNDTVYRAKRRRDNKVSSAVLFGNDVALVEGAREVTAEISALLGMDARGFRLAVVAQQKELDGLASMRPGERAVTLARLLRLDVVTAARDRARAIFRSERDGLKGLGAVEGTETLLSEISRRQAAHSELTGEYDKSEGEVARLNAELAKSAGVEEAYTAASEQRARLLAMRQSAEQEWQRLKDELDQIIVGPDPGSLPDTVAISEKINKVERDIAVAEANTKLSDQADMVRVELGKVVQRLNEIELNITNMGVPDVSGSQEAVKYAQEFVEQRRQTLSSAKEDLIRTQTALVAHEHRLSELGDLTATCDLCGQTVSETHRHSQLSSTQDKLGRTKKALSAAEKKHTKERDGLDEALGALGRAGEKLAVEIRKNEELVTLLAESQDLTRRRHTYTDQLSRLSGEKVDVSELRRERGALAIELAEAQNAREASMLRQLVIERQTILEAAVAGAQERKSWAQEASDAGEIPPGLVAEHAAHQANELALASETALLADLATQTAVSAEAIKGAQRDLERLNAQRTRRTELEAAAVIASECALVLDRVSTRLNQQIRPALEGSVGELLSRLSDGRFDMVSLDEEYNLSVRDGGAMRVLGDFSGGEVDLIALAVRLALASVVSDRHGSGGAGFLILDECFGSQDQDRRGSILTALRSLRGVYGQILLISHVGGLEDSADRVIEVSIDEESGMACVATN
jgi:exonuclease SbcC